MQPADFSTNTTGRLVPTQGCWAFVPNPLPPPLTLSWELVEQLSKADRGLSELAGVARTLPNPHLLIDPFIRHILADSQNRIRAIAGRKTANGGNLGNLKETFKNLAVMPGQRLPVEVGK